MLLKAMRLETISTSKHKIKEKILNQFWRKKQNPLKTNSIDNKLKKLKKLYWFTNLRMICESDGACRNLWRVDILRYFHYYYQKTLVNSWTCGYRNLKKDTKMNKTNWGKKYLFLRSLELITCYIHTNEHCV